MSVPSSYEPRGAAVPGRCAVCGARMGRGDDWCNQCYAPRVPPQAAARVPAARSTPVDVAAGTVPPVDLPVPPVPPVPSVPPSAPVTGPGAIPAGARADEARADEARADGTRADGTRADDVRADDVRADDTRAARTGDQDPAARAAAEVEAERLLAELSTVDAGPALPGPLLALRGNPVLGAGLAIGGAAVVVLAVLGVLAILGAVL